MEEFHKAVYSCCAETILFVENEQKFMFTTLLMALDISSFDFWKLINSYIVFDP